MPGIEDLQNKMSEKSLTNFLNTDSEQIIFGIEAQINNLMGEYEMALRNGEMARAMDINNQINELDKMKIDIANQSGRTISNIDSGRTISDIDRQGRTISDIDRQMMKGYAEGDEVSMMMMELEGDQGMSKSDMEGLEGLAEISGPETEMLNNIINQIIELIAQGATEEEVIAFLRQQGLDEEDISAVMSMLSQQLTAGEESIDSQLQGMM